MSTPIVVWGASGLARDLNEFLGDAGFTLVALFDNDASVGSPFPGVAIYHGQDGLRTWLAQGPRAGHAFLIAVGGDRGEERLALQTELERHGLRPATVAHPSAAIARSASIGAGTQVHALAHVGAAARIGTGCIINAGASIGHESNIGDGVHIGPGAVLCGCVTVGRSAFVGAGAVVLPRIRIGERAVVGAGAAVFGDVAAGSSVLGNPAKPLSAARIAARSADGER